jgi:hypothetical protein
MNMQVLVLKYEYNRLVVVSYDFWALSVIPVTTLEQNQIEKKAMTVTNKEHSRA